MQVSLLYCGQPFLVWGMATLPLFHLFSAGEHTDRWNRRYLFTEDCVREMAECYDPARYAAPILLGHDSGECGGYLGETIFFHGHLCGVPAMPLPESFSQAAVGRGVSVELFTPDCPDNPVPGAWGISHVALEPYGETALELLPPQFRRAEEAGKPRFLHGLYGGVEEERETAEVRDLRRRLRQMEVRQRLEGLAGKDLRLPPRLLSGWEAILVAVDDLAAAAPPQFRRGGDVVDMILRELGNLPVLARTEEVSAGEQQSPQFRKPVRSPTVEELAAYVEREREAGRPCSVSEAYKRLTSGGGLDV